MDVLQCSWTPEQRLKPSAGLVVFEDDPVSAPTIQSMLGAAVDIHVARMPFAPPGDVEALEQSLADAAATILPSQPPPLIGFSCTTGAVELGRARLKAAVCCGSSATTVADPAHAAFEAFQALRAKRIAIVSPYGQTLSQDVADTFAKQGFEVSRLIYLDAKDVVSISGLSIIDASRRAAASNIDALFLSCTGMQAVPLIETLEAELERPVVTSLQALAWAMATHFGIRCHGPGKLFGRL